MHSLRPFRVRSSLAVALTFVLLAVACGTRVPDRDVRAALAAHGGGAVLGAGAPKDAGTQGKGRGGQNGPGRRGGGKGHQGGPKGGGGSGPSSTTGGQGSGGSGPASGGHNGGGSGPSARGGGSGPSSTRGGPHKAGHRGGGGSPRSTPGPGGHRGGGKGGKGHHDGGGPGPSPGATQGPRTCHGGATDTGVTSTSIETGASYAESSLIPGLFRPAIDAVQAYFSMVNRAGGVCGRKIDFKSYNDELNAQAYQENVRHLVEDDKVFALVGSLSAADSGGCSYMSHEQPPEGAPDIGTFALSYCRAQSGNHYSPVGSLKKGIYGCCGEWNFLRKRFGYTKPASHYLDVEISRDQGLAVVDSLVRQLHLSGRDDVYQGEHSPAQFDYSGDVIRMQQAGVDAVWSSMDLNNDVKMIRAICQQEWRPKVIHLESSSYDPALIQRVGAQCIESQNIWVRTNMLPFNEKGNHELSLYLSTLHSYCPDCQPTPFGLEGWLTAKLFVEALDKAGADLTRARLYSALDSVRNWTGGGVMGPITPSERLIFSCNYMLRVRANGFFRESGLECGPFYRSGDYDGPPVYRG
jgi:hypothetical protein